VQGEEQKKLDVISNDIFCNCLRMSGRTGVIASEEEATPVAVEETDSGNYIVVFDPLDGSSNIDAGENAAVLTLCMLGQTAVVAVQQLRQAVVRQSKCWVIVFVL
jgi:fructose-1,6-bisphosphatase